MKQSLLVAAIASTLALAACSKSPDNGDTASQTPPPADSAQSTAANGTDASATQAMATPDQQAPSSDAAMGGANAGGDSLALGLLAAVDENEVAAAKQAQDKKVSGAVLDYAKMMQKEHTENLDQTKALGSLSDAGDVAAVKEKGANELNTLGAKSGKEYSAAYIDAMIAGHQEALSMIDGKMMAAATTDPVKKHLTDTRMHVAQHLAKAQDIKKSM